MPDETSKKATGLRGFMARFARDVRGNTLAIMAIAMIPLAGMVGGGIDISRLYIAKTRLQHACDAGALAGRKSMGGGTWGTDDSTVAQSFFTGNFQAGAYDTTSVTSTFTENAGKVSGTASAAVPLTLVKVVMGGNAPAVTLTVTCDAEMRLPNTDVMFVLDTTGSMACDSSGNNCNSGSSSKIAGLKTAVKCFYEIVARLDTDANCTTGTPSGGTGTQVQIRFGFVPYSSNVNVGKLLPTSYLADSWKYQSRVRNGSAWGDWYGVNYTYPTSNGSCNTPTNTSTKQYRSTVNFYRGYGNLCYNESRDQSPQWDYKQVTVDVSPLKSGSTWNSSFQLPINNDGSNKTINWSGCIEERKTVQTTSFSPIPSGAKDLNIDLVPSSNDPESLWGPSLPDLIWFRNIVSSYSEATTANTTTTTNYYNSFGYTCPQEAKKLQAWPNATTFDDYVDTLTASGNTYHDIGMLWGARLMSAEGIFASENRTTPQGGEIQRNLIFMTDGDSTSSPCDYNAYGVPFWDQRQTTDVGSASNCGSNRQALIDQIDLRLQALCTAVKNKNITLWVVAYGNGVNTGTGGKLETCASSGKYFSAADPAALQNTFKSIANQISALRLTR